MEPWFVVWSFFSPENALYLYKFIILSCMDYCCRVWAGVPSCYLDMLDKLQDRVFKTIGLSHAAFLHSLVHHWNLASLSLFSGEIVCTPPFLLEGGGGGGAGWIATQILKRGGLAEPQLLEGDCQKRGELGQFVNLRGRDLARKMGWCFWGWVIPQMHTMRYYLGKCSSELAELVSLPYSCMASILDCSGLYNLPVPIPR